MTFVNLELSLPMVIKLEREMFKYLKDWKKLKSHVFKNEKFMYLK